MAIDTNKIKSDYLLSKGWRLGNRKNEYLDPWQRAIRYLDDAYDFQKAREVCNHEHTDKFTIKGVTRCGFCGEKLNSL